MYSHPGRALNDYLPPFSRILALSHPMILFTNEATVATYSYQRRHHQHTYIITRPFADTFFGNLTAYTTEILLSDVWNRCTYDRRFRLENVLPSYSLMTLNQVAFLQEVVRYDPYGSEYFVWVDAGVGRFDPSFKHTAWPSITALRRYDSDGRRLLVQGAVPSVMADSLKTRASVTHPLDNEGKATHISIHKVDVSSHTFVKQTHHKTNNKHIP